MGSERVVHGSAKLIVGGNEVSTVDYNLTISTGSHGAISADGTITGDEGLSLAWERGEAVLRLTGGREMGIFLTEWNPMASEISVKSSGQIPPL